MRLQLCAFYAPRGINPDRIINATAAEFEFFLHSRDQYFRDEKMIVQDAIAEIVNQVKEANK